MQTCCLYILRTECHTQVIDPKNKLMYTEVALGLLLSCPSLNVLI